MRCGMCAATLAMAACLAISSFARPQTGLAVDVLAPRFVRPDLDHHPVDLRAYRGHVVLLTFWATWCAPCLIEMPRFASWQSQYGPEGLQVLGVSMDDDVAAVRTLCRKKKVNYPVVMADEKLAALYGGVLGLPVTYLINREGRIAAKFKGETDLDAMEVKIRELIGKQK